MVMCSLMVGDDIMEANPGLQLYKTQVVTLLAFCNPKSEQTRNQQSLRVDSGPLICESDCPIVGCVLQRLSVIPFQSCCRSKGPGLRGSKFGINVLGLSSGLLGLGTRNRGSGVGIWPMEIKV